MADKVFKSIWGEMTFPGEKVIDQVEKKEETPATVIDTNVSIVQVGDDEDEDEKPPVVVTPTVTPPAKKEDEEESIPVELTEEEVNKAYTFLLDEQVLEDLGDDADFEASGKGLADAIAATVRAKLQKEISSIPPVVQDFYAHVTAGQDPKAFVPKEETGSWAQFDTSTDEGKRVALRAFYRLQGMPEDEIESEVDDAEVNGKLEKKSDIAIKALEKKEQDEQTARAAATAKQEADDRAKAQKDIEDLNKLIDTSEEIAGFKLDDTRRKKFKQYLFKKNPRTGLTQLQENMSSEERKLQIAFLDFANYNKADLEKEVASNLTVERKKKLSRYTRGNITNQSTQSVKTKVDKQGGKVQFPTIFGQQKIEIED